jgi:RNA polymerase sigma-70 factor (ECF subfamily)
MSSTNSFAQLMTRLRAGDQPAAAEVFHRFAERLIALARTRLDRRLRQKVDPEDVLQSVYKSFFRRYIQGDFELADWDGLWSLLTVLTVRKCGRWRERFRAECRDVERETSLTARCDGAGWHVLDREPTPGEAAVLTDTVEQLLQHLEERDRDIVSLTLQGYPVAEIARQLDRPERTVFRVLEHVKKRLRRVEDSDDLPST